MADTAEAGSLKKTQSATGDVSMVEVTEHPMLKDQASHDQQEFANRVMEAKVHELARLKQRQIVTRAVQSLEQLHLELNEQPQTQQGAKPSCKDTASADASTASISLESITTSSSLSSSSSASSIRVEAEHYSESEDGLDEGSACSTAAPTIQCSPLQQQQADSVIPKQCKHDVQEQATAVAAAAAAVAALQGITKVQNRNHSRDRKDSRDVWHPSSRQFSAALTKAIAAAAPGGRWPGDARDDSLADSPRSTSTTASSKTTSSSRAASSKPDTRRPRVSRSLYGHTDSNSSVGRNQAAACDADGPPPGFGSPAYDNSRCNPAANAVSTHQNATHQQMQSAVVHVVDPSAQAPPGFGPAAPPSPPPGFAGMRCGVADPGLCAKTPQARVAGPSVAPQPRRTPGAGQAAKPRRMGQSRLFQGALAGAVAERS